jgi:hypothetical protein
MEQSAAQQEYIENVRICNGRSMALTVSFEPFVSTYDIPPGEHIIVSSRGPVGDGVEITVGTDGCTVWGWPGSSMVVLHNGEIVIDWRRVKMPSTPVPNLRELGESLWANVREAELG